MNVDKILVKKNNNDMADMILKRNNFIIERDRNQNFFINNDNYNNNIPNGYNIVKIQHYKNLNF